MRTDSRVVEQLRKFHLGPCVPLVLSVWPLNEWWMAKSCRFSLLLTYGQRRFISSIYVENNLRSTENLFQSCISLKCYGIKPAKKHANLTWSLNFNIIQNGYLENRKLDMFWTKIFIILIILVTNISITLKWSLTVVIATRHKNMSRITSLRMKLIVLHADKPDRHVLYYINKHMQTYRKYIAR